MTTQRLAMSLYSHQQRKRRKGQSPGLWPIGTSIDMLAKSHICVLNLPSDKLCYLTACDYSIDSWKTVSRLSLISLKESSPYCINTLLAPETQQTLCTRRKHPVQVIHWVQYLTDKSEQTINVTAILISWTGGYAGDLVLQLSMNPTGISDAHQVIDMSANPQWM